MPPSASALIEIYEERVQRLEDGVSDCRVELGVLKSQLADGVSMLSEKLDVVAKLSERVAALETREQIANEVRMREEHQRARRHERRGRIFKVGAAVGSGIVAIIGLILKIWFGG
jgi:hypothetical protein